MTHSLKITVHKVENLDDVERAGKNDPYVQATLDIKIKDSFQKTSVKKNAGKNAEWNETLSLENYIPGQHHTLYVEVLESDIGIDPPIAFAAIPLSQLTSAQGHVLRGVFKLYTPSGKEEGTVHLTLAAVQAGQAAPHGDHVEVKGLTQIESEHKHRIETLKRNEKVGDAATAAAIIGGLFASKAIYDSTQKKDVPKEI
ncbi:hypothetical protein BGZ70_010245 [Mortierella alpina]|uniref:C2 domain-containing protein n=1 Tax=Mortierella alpina TaxID=64518 RepID=A0A9P6LYV8_MORAP|nr:hypothetical protein BGZ70_010245 [Mortierella alpina]